MSAAAPSYEAISEGAGRLGLRARGGFHPLPTDGAPRLSSGGEPGTVVLIGNVGPEFWESAGPAVGKIAEANPLDRWVVKQVGDLATSFGAEVVFPFGGPPHWPFQRWAQRAEAVAPSPIGILIHPDYGLWHAYRAALLFASRLDLPVRVERPVPCISCGDKPCLTTCPVGAFQPTGYAVATCVAHVGTSAGADCASHGCAARRACPVGRPYTYPVEESRFHMRAFVRAMTPR